MANVVKDLGAVSAYALAVEYGYKGTEEEWATLQINSAEASKQAKNSAEVAKQHADNAEMSATTADKAVDAVKVMQNQTEKTAAAAQASAEAAESQATSASEYAAQASAHESAAELSANSAEASRQAAQVVLDSIPHDYSNLSKLADGLAIIAEASGSILSIHDSVAARTVSLVSEIKPSLNGAGTPSLTNVRPVKGWDEISVICSSRNLLPYTPDDAKEFTYKDGDETVAAKGYEAIHLPPGTYNIRGAYKEGYSSGAYVAAKVLDANGVNTSKSVLSPVWNATVRTAEFTIEDGEYLIIHNGSAGQNLVTTKTKFGTVELGIYAEDADTTYEENTRTSQTAAMSATVYGGRFDWMSGMLTVTHKIVELTGTEAWTQVSGYSIFTTTAQMSDVVAANSEVHSLCSHFNTTAYVSSAKMADASTFLMSNPLMRFRHNGCATTDEWKAWLAGQAAAGTPVSVVFELTTPYEVQLSPAYIDLLKDYTAMWSDCGDTSVVYAANTKLYIDNKIAAIAAAIVNG